MGLEESIGQRIISKQVNRKKHQLGRVGKIVLGTVLP